ncbi:30S ribosomal protein S11, chloroplastic [Hordeum vulgare]|nr:30S ribosomal protein S11, chloroplastic [Hordeum vulgare]
MFRVRLENDTIILGYISGKIRSSSIRILMGDRVKIETHKVGWFSGPRPVLVDSKLKKASPYAGQRTAVDAIRYSRSREIVDIRQNSERTIKMEVIL